MIIGWIGAGIMGKPMVQHLVDNGHTVHVYARNPQKIQDLTKVTIEPSIESLVDNVDIVCTMVGFPSDVEEVYEKIFRTEAPKICIDFTTSSPKLAQELYKKAPKNIEILDAPVTGGDVGAKKGTLTILVGGKKEVFENMMPIFSSFGKEIHYCGEAGSGQLVKISNQIMIANTLQGICEAMSYLSSQGLDPKLVIDCLQHGAAGSSQLSLQGEKILNKDDSPGFYIKHFVKDLNIALDQNDVELTGVQNVIEEYQKLMEKGMGNLGTQALIHYFKQD